jgi:hypothetical protein
LRMYFNISREGRTKARSDWRYNTGREAVKAAEETKKKRKEGIEIRGLR